MLKNYTLIVFCLCASITFGLEKPIVQKSKITQVTVYVEGASIDRSASVTIQPGVNEVVFGNLSPEIIESSIQFAGLDRATILSIGFDYNFLDKKEVSEEYKSLETQLDKLRYEHSALQNKIGGYQRELDLLEKNDRINSDNTDLSLDKVKQIATYYRERSTEIKNIIYKSQREIKDIEKQIADYREEMKKLDDDKKERRGEITLKLDSEIAQNLDLKLSYIVQNAGWFPLYNIRAKNTTSPLSLHYKANVYQQTGARASSTTIP